MAAVGGRAAVAIAAILLFLGSSAAPARGALPAGGRIDPVQAPVGDRLLVEVTEVGWACVPPRSAELGFRPVWRAALEDRYTWVPVRGDPAGRRFELPVPAIDAGPYGLLLRCDAGEPLHVAGLGFGATDGPYVDFTVLPVVRPGDESPVWVWSQCGSVEGHETSLNLWISQSRNVRGPSNPHLTRVAILAHRQEGYGLSVVWFRVPAVAPGPYYAYSMLPEPARDPSCTSAEAFERAPIVGDGPALLVVGSPDTATTAARDGGPASTVLVLVGAFILGALLSLRRARLRATVGCHQAGHPHG